MATKKTRKTISKWDPVPPVGHNDDSGEVLTKPNQSMSIRDILFRNTQGMSYDNYKTPYYEDQATFSSEAINKIQDMEPVEKIQYLKELDTKVKDLKGKIEADEKAKAEAIATKQKEEAERQALAQQNDNTTTE